MIRLVFLILILFFIIQINKSFSKGKDDPKPTSEEPKKTETIIISEISESSENKEAPPDFIIHQTGDRQAGDLSDPTTTENLKKCQDKCKENNDCIGISYNETEKKCFLKGTTGGGEGGRGTLGINYVSPSPYQFYYKNIPGYEIKGAGDRVAGDIEGMPVTKVTLKSCADVCDSKTNCIGFSYDTSSDKCFAKKSDGLANDYTQTAYQFYTKKS